MIYLKCGRFEWIQSDPCNGVAPVTYILEWKKKEQSFLELPEPLSVSPMSQATGN